MYRAPLTLHSYLLFALSRSSLLRIFCLLSLVFSGAGIKFPLSSNINQSPSLEPSGNSSTLTTHSFSSSPIKSVAISVDITSMTTYCLFTNQSLFFDILKSSLTDSPDFGKLPEILPGPILFYSLSTPLSDVNNLSKF